MKISSLAFATLFLACGVGAASAQDSRVAPGTMAPNTPRVAPNGDVSPAPSQTVTGGVGTTETSAPNPSQTKTGGPAGGPRGNGGGG